MHMDPLLPTLTAIGIAILAIGLVSRWLGQPSVVGYLIAGIVLGPDVFGVVADETIVSRIGSIGVVLLLFFIGMEVAPRRLIATWRIAVLGTVLQIAVSVGGIWILGSILDWGLNRVVLLGFVISLSSTAVVIKLLQDRREIDSPLGGQVVSLLLMQDVAVVVMLIVLGLLSGEAPTVPTLLRQLAGALLLLVIFVRAAKGPITVGLLRWIGDEKEVQVFAALAICLGLSFLSGVLDLSTALGAFIGGILVTAARETRWIHDALEPFRVVFVAGFFVSVGMLLDLDFVVSQWWLLAILTTMVFVSNTFVNALILRAFGVPVRDSLYGGALLAPIGEFSFILATVGEQAGVITSFAYQATLATITLTLLLASSWSAMVVALANRWGQRG